MTHYLLAVHGPAETGEFGSYGSKEEMEESLAAQGSKACRGKVEVRPFDGLA